MTDARFHIGPVDRLYELVLGMVENRHGAETRDKLAAYLRSIEPTTAHLSVMLVEMALSGTPMGEAGSAHDLVLAGFTSDGEPILHLRPSCGKG